MILLKDFYLFTEIFQYFIKIYCLTVVIFYLVFYFLKRRDKDFIEPSEPTTELLRSLRALLIASAINVLAMKIESYRLIDLRVYSHFIQLPILILLHDFYFYWTHRFMHKVKFFRKFHTIHHIQSDNYVTPFSGLSFSIFESVIQFAFLPIINLFVFHTVSLEVTVAILFWTGFVHIGDLLKFNGVFAKIFISSQDHKEHHRSGKRYYGLYFKFWDYFSDRWASLTLKP